MEKYAEGRLMRLKSLIFLLALSPSSWANDPILVIGKPASERFIKALPPPDGVIWTAATYEVKLKPFRVISGELKPSKSLKLELVADDSGIISSEKEIYVLFEMKSDGKPEVIEWGAPTYEVCVEYSELNRDPKDGWYTKKIASGDLHCKPIYERRLDN